MDWLNYHHLYYFWMIAKCGSVNEAATELRLRQPTLSAQLSSLEASLGEKLFDRKGRKLILTEVGRVVNLYAEEIFSIGSELRTVVKNKNYVKPKCLTIGIVNSIPKLIAYRILRPILRSSVDIKIICKEDSLDKLIGELGVHQIDAILSDATIPVGISIKAYNHMLGESGISFMATAPFIKKYKNKFPNSLSGAPIILPTHNSPLRSQIDLWLRSNEIYPKVIGEFEDSALLKMFGKEGMGICICPSAIEKEVRSQYNMEVLGRIDEIKERFFIISATRKIDNPLINIICNRAQNKIFN